MFREVVERGWSLTPAGGRVLTDLLPENLPAYSDRLAEETTVNGRGMTDLNCALSRVEVEPVTEQAGKAAAEPLKSAGLHGHKHTIDATVAEVALRQPKPVALLTSDSDDMAKLCVPSSEREFDSRHPLFDQGPGQ